MPLIQPIVTASGGSNFVPQTRILTINGVSYDLSADRTWTVEVLDNLIATAPLSYSSGTNTISISQSSASADGYLSSADWLTFSAKQPAITLTTTGNSGVSTLVGATLNIPEYTLAGLGGMANVFTSLGDTVYSNAGGLPVRRSGNITTTKMFLSQTGDGTSSAAPIWSVVTATDVGAITSLTGEATGSGSGAVAVTLTNSAVIGKVLTGLNVTGGSVISTDTILQGFGKLQNQVNGLVGGVMYQGTWNASTNSPTLTSSVGTKGYYYVVSVAGSTNLDGVTDWKIGDWAIYNGSTWEKVDNTDSVTSVNGFTGAVTLTTSNVAEGTNLYYTEARVDANTNVAANTAARHNALTIGTANGLSLSTQVLSLALASTSVTGALSSTDWTTFNAKQPALSGTGFVKISGTTISYDNSTYYLASNPSAYITLTSLSAGSGISYNNTTGVITSTITQYTDALARLAISESVTGLDYDNTTGVFTLTSGYVIPTTTSATNWDAAYNDKINSAAVTGTTTKTLTLTQQDGGTITATWTDDNTDAVTSVFGRTGAVVATSGDYTTTLVTEGTNLYFTNARAIASTLTGYVSGAGTISSADTILGAIQKLNGNIGALTTGVSSVNGLTGAVTLTTTNIAEGTNLYYTDTRARASVSFVAGSGAYNSTTGVITIPTNNNQITNGAAYITLSSLSAGTGISYNNTTGVITSTITQYTDALARASISETITGIDYNNTTGVFSITSGYGIPTTAKQTEWDTAFTNRITSLTTTGSSGAATLISNTLNIPTYTAAGLGAVPTSRTLTINDVAFDLTANREWSVGDYGTW